MPAAEAAGGIESMSDQNKPGNRRTALILLSVAVAFFIGVIIKHVLLK